MIRYWSCQDGVQAQFDNIKAELSRSIGEISAAFQRVEASGREAQKGLAALLGPVISSRTDLQSVVEQVKGANNDQLGSFLERLHLTAAKQRWKDLASGASSLSQSPN
jgi:hypothetical protein